MAPWAAALTLTVVIEVPVVAALFPGQRWRMAWVALVMNVATNVTLNVVLPRLSFLRGHYLLPGEVLAVLSEAAAYALASRPRDVLKSVLASSLANSLSFAAGFLPILRWASS